MKILMLSDWFFYYTARIANELDGLGHDVVLVTRDHGSELGETENPESVKRAMLSDSVSMMVLRGRQGSLRGVVSAVDLFRQCKRFNPDVVHVQYHYDWRLESIRRGLRCPSLATVHDVTSHLGARVSRNGVQVWAERSLLTHCSGYIVHGESLRDDLLAREYYRGQPVFSIPHGPLAHPIASPRPLPAVPTALFFGRLEEYKGLHEFVDASRRAQSHIPELRCVVAGDGALACDLMAWTADDPLFDIRVGFVLDESIPALMADCSVVVLPYLDASQSGVIPIAYANGRAVVASRVGALPEAIDEGETGWLVPPGDSMALSDCLVNALSDTTLLWQCGHRAWLLVSEGRLSASFVAAEHVAAYRSITRPPRCV